MIVNIKNWRIMESVKMVRWCEERGVEGWGEEREYSGPRSLPSSGLIASHYRPSKTEELYR